jgi:hypothetical protein
LIDFLDFQSDHVLSRSELAAFNRRAHANEHEHEEDPTHLTVTRHPDSTTTHLQLTYTLRFDKLTDEEVWEVLKEICGKNEKKN